MSDAQIRADEGGLVVNGPLTFATVAGLEARARGLTAHLPEHARVDLTQAGRIDSAGVAFLVILWRRAREQGRTLVFEPLPEGLRPLLELYDLESIITDSAARSVA
ncbi:MULTISPECIES: lipid asymmetry maintenance protein MlaB [Thioalkalivibrio]|uniref:STAS domain-containing protein n=1 Tax=Thioalkalivibrio TaxID=106633 RepID=UPI0003746903|nr:MULTISPECIES: STAS domain-containing protein [Thioalkalivibrio]OOC49492.1 anti-anti-sigma factor [Thioalkalivibrio versutus]